MKRMHKWSLVFLGVVIASALLLSIMSGNRGATFPPLPVPNGYDDFVAAGKLVTADLDSAYKMDFVLLRAFVAANAESSRLLQLGLARTSAVPLAAFVTNQSRMMEDLATIKRLAQFNVVAGCLAELEGRTNEAVAIHLQGMRFANEATRGAVVIHGLVGIACENLAFIQLTNLIARTSSDQLQKIIIELEQVDAAAISWTEIMKSERLFMSHVAPFDGNPISWIRNWWGSRSAVQKAEMKCLQYVIQRRRFLVELALRRYAAEKGSPPQQLSDLVPDYLSRLPENPTTEQPPDYRPQGTNWVLEFKL